MFSARRLTPHDWYLLRDLRLTALSESPDAFLSTYDRESAYTEQTWRNEFARGDWSIATRRGRPIVGATLESAARMHERHLEYLWVSPEYRRFGVASMLLSTVLDHLRDSGVATALLWILDGNVPALRLYERFGFTSTHERQPLEADPARSEERMTLSLRGDSR